MELVNKVVAIAIGLFVAAVILPVALIQMANTTWYDVDPAVVTIVSVLLPILGVVAIAMYFLRD